MWLLPEGHAWDMTRYGDMVNERAVCILLECILVIGIFDIKHKTLNNMAKCLQFSFSRPIYCLIVPYISQSTYSY